MCIIIFRAAVSIKRFVLPIARAVPSSGDRAADKHCLQELYGRSTSTAWTELCNERSPILSKKPSRLIQILGPRTKSVCHLISVVGLLALIAERTRSPGYFEPGTESDKWPERQKCRNSKSSYTSPHRCWGSSQESLIVIKPGNSYYIIALGYHKCFVGWLQQYDEGETYRIAKLKKQI